MDFDLGPQEKFSFGQFLFANTWWRLWWRLWYRKVQVRGFKHIYTKKPMIVTPNHQNAAIDALVMVGIQTRQLVWLARADVFKSKIARSFLKFFGVMPVYRMHDGKESLGNNEKIFRKAVDILKANRLLAIFPEATHWGFRRLRPIKKAVPRIAFLAEDLSDTPLDIHILPVGIYYENYVGVRRNLFVNIGEPFPITEYVEMRKENENKAQIALRDRIQDEMKKYMLHIPHEGELYSMYDELRFICAECVAEKNTFQGSSMYVDFQIHSKVIEILNTAFESTPDTIETLRQETEKYVHGRKELQYRETILATQGGDPFDIIWNCLKLLCGFPIFLVGFISTALQYKYVYAFAQKIAKDVQFHNSITFVLGFLIIPISYSIISIIVVLSCSLSWWMFFVIGAILLICAVISLDYRSLAKKTYHMLRYKIQDFTNSKKLTDIQHQRSRIISLFCELF